MQQQQTFTLVYLAHTDSLRMNTYSNSTGYNYSCSFTNSYRFLMLIHY